MLLWVLAAVGVGAATMAIQTNQVPKTGFSCEGRTMGYYADVDSGCQVYHMCDGLGRQFSYTCPNATLFQQRMLICDHWYMVNCSKSVDDYTANLRIGRKMPFVDDSESNPYHRTPRPDLLSHPSQKEYDIIYRTGKAQLGTNLNLVGAESDKTSTTDEPAYSLPSHWSTEYSNRGTTSKPKTFSKKIDASPKGKLSPASPPPIPINFKSNFKATTPVFPKHVDFTTEAPVTVNYQSNFKATTPVFPTSVDVNSEAPDEAGVVPPLPYQMAGHTSNLETTTKVPVNFQSRFKATTPVYPKTVDITSEEPAEAGVLPPLGGNNIDSNVPTLNLGFEPPAITKFDPNTRNEKVEVLPSPSKFYQPPKFEPDFTETENVRSGALKILSNNEWEDLKKKFFIPDYEFPLETVSRPSYDTVYSSFQASGSAEKKK